MKHTTVQKFEDGKIFLINTFIKQGCIKLIKSYNKESYPVTKKNAVLMNFLKNPELFQEY